MAPILFEGILKERELIKALRKYHLKQSDIKSIHYANNATLIYLKKRTKMRPKKEIIPSRALEEEIILVDAFVEEYRYLIELERVAEIEAQIREIKTISGRERELFGRALLHLRAKYLQEKFYFHLVRFYREKEIEIEIAPGDVVLLSLGEPLQSDLQGTVYEIKRHFITVAFENRPPKWLFKNRIRLDLYINDITFKRMEENLLSLRHVRGRSREIRNILLSFKVPKRAAKEPFLPKNETLNTTQKEAVALALGSEDLFLIHGPPGTGKTSTVVELIYQEVKRGRRVLATADSNVAVDNMLVRLASLGLKLVRIGHPVRIDAKLERYSIHFLYEHHTQSEAIKSGWAEVKALVEERDRFSKPTPSRSRGMGEEKIMIMAQKGRRFRGISSQTMVSMASWIRANAKVTKRIEALQEREAAIYQEILREADVVFATNAMVSSDLLEGHRFDIAVIDEGSQQMVPSSLIPIMKADRFVIAGDHKQLPPTVISNHYKLKESLFEKLLKYYPSYKRLLEVQYRMHEQIMSFSNRHFYDNRLVADGRVKEHTLEDLGVAKSQRLPFALAPQHVVVFLDTKEQESLEQQSPRSTSFYNSSEASVVTELVQGLLKMGLKEEAVGVITPYSGQIKEIKRRLSALEIGVEVKSVDGFQGREKEVILLSLVRSNEQKEIGFLKDGRRLNVAITRAKRKLVVVGNSPTLQSDTLYRDFIAYVKEVEGYVVL